MKQGILGQINFIREQIEVLVVFCLDYNAAIVKFPHQPEFRGKKAHLMTLRGVKLVLDSRPCTAVQ